MHQILINEKYIGNNVWNRVSFKLKKKSVHNDPGMWIRADGAFPAIVDRHLFEAAQSIIRHDHSGCLMTKCLASLRDSSNGKVCSQASSSTKRKGCLPAAPTALASAASSGL